MHFWTTVSKMETVVYLYGFAKDTLLHLPRGYPLYYFLKQE